MSEKARFWSLLVLLIAALLLVWLLNSSFGQQIIVRG